MQTQRLVFASETGKAVSPLTRREAPVGAVGEKRYERKEELYFGPYQKDIFGYFGGIFGYFGKEKRGKNLFFCFLMRETWRF